ncbi:MAG: Fic family protein [Chlamydiae bacterium]|nr:Fic family protein [Chlamydiota bacterium]MBI3265612.1 Fic family protein [Chlamydiota bacterium]
MEGERLNRASVRSSVARHLTRISHHISAASADSASSASSDSVGHAQHTAKYASHGLGRLPRIQSGLGALATKSDEKCGLGLPAGGLPAASRHVDGLVEVLLDATVNHHKPLTALRLKHWRAALFPTGHSGLSRIRVGNWRSIDPPMQVVSDPIGREKIHYEAPPGKKVEEEMKQFLIWWKESLRHEEGLLRSGLAHFYFVTIHPFEDGNGRMARVLTDMALAQDEKLATRYYSLSSQIMEDRSSYYDVLEECQKGKGDVTRWLQWYLDCYCRSVEGAEKLIADVLAKAEFWQRSSTFELNARQCKVVNCLLDAGRGGFEGGLTTRKYVSMARVSRATAFREISDLVKKDVLRQNPSKGRSVSYDINWGT